MSTQDDEFAREIEAHLELEADQLRNEGLPPEDARAAAHRRFGNVVAAKERRFESQRLPWLDRLQQDTRGAWRSLRRSPITSIVAILSLAAGIGATTVTLTIRDIVFRRPPPAYADAGRLSHIQVGSPANPIRPAGNGVPPALFARWRESLGSSIGGAIALGRRTVRAADRREDISIRSATPELFAVLGVQPVAGVDFGKLTGTASLGSSAVLSHRVWEQLFDARPEAIGQSLWIDDRAYTVIGVLPPRFWFPDMDSPVWTALDPARLPQDQVLMVVARRPGRETHAMLESKLKAGLDAYTSQLPEDQRQLLVRASGVEGTPTARQMALVLPYVLGTAVLLTLLIACANVAILLIARWTAREHEIAIRASIGASRGRIIRSLLAESITIAVLAAVLGAGVTFALNAWIASRSNGGGFYDLSVNWGLLVQVAALTLGVGIITGILPALHETRRLNANPLRAMAGADRTRQRWRHTLVVLEITVTIALLVVTAAMVDGYFRVTRADLGYVPTQLLMMRVENPAVVPTARVVEAVANVPGVSAAAASTAVPFIANGTRVPVRATSTSEQVVVERAEIDDRFFSTLGVQMVAGRSFARAEARESRTAIVNQALAERILPGRDALGAHLLVDGAPLEIVGIVEGYATNPMRATIAEPRLFVPLAPGVSDVKRMTFVIRADGTSPQLIQRVRDEVGRLGNGTVVTSAETMPHIIEVVGQEMLVGTAPLMPLVSIGILLTTAGIYGVLAFAIARRSRELAVRVALGASAWGLVRLVVGHTTRLVAVGTVAGLLAMVALSRLVRASGGAGSIWDPSLAAFLIPIGFVCVIAAVATWVPSRRALAIDPIVLLRQQ
jgi:putative ABC transport system permease protein